MLESQTIAQVLLKVADWSHCIQLVIPTAESSLVDKEEISIHPHQPRLPNEHIAAVLSSLPDRQCTHCKRIRRVLPTTTVDLLAPINLLRFIVRLRW